MAEIETVFLPDCHVPYLDERAWYKALDFIEESDPNDVVILGDFLDFYYLSSYDKFPGFKAVGDEIAEGKLRLQELRQVFKGVVVYCEGNHEYRLKSSTTRRESPASSRLLRCEPQVTSFQGTKAPAS